ncbi:Enoyl-CoA hydratase/carnithine racemase [Pseudidiomarina planktonica]|uniref:Enoyl-CoA hydratase/carnithine racemase n=1 Tax=Pseudidiomarina planktonica TaxID=1323738 RepID=A0A1Y6F3T1_9GAMM|nr:enoyl-CoA hydratase [Pseudidiomarina planktonica]RUO64939.1 enoyl-CoA hydratase [Pseudidiomarina planktonica]SMQ69156.1 Enoyl-CoA hydratase/carnithine racemase [Pseudidiomarina planktonica]
MSQDVNIEVTDKIVTITLTRTSKKNALTQAMYAEMTEALKQADANKEIAAVIIQGAADSFTAGNDLQDFLKMESIDEEAPVFQFLHTIANVSVPLVASVNGLAIGIGTTLLLHCDLVYASRDARFSLPFIHLGLVPEAASSLLLPQLCGRVRAAELLLLGDMFNAEQALQYGIVNQVVDNDALSKRVSEVAQQLADKPVAGLRASKKLMRAPTESVDDRIAREVKVFAAALATPEAKAAIAARLQKK